MPDLTSWIAAAREALAKATPGKWKANLYLGGAYAIDRIAPNGDVLARVAVVDGLLATPANARSIVLAVNALPALLDVAEAAAKYREANDRQEEIACDRSRWDSAECEAASLESIGTEEALDAALARLAEEEAIRDR